MHQRTTYSAALGVVLATASSLSCQADLEPAGGGSSPGGSAGAPTTGGVSGAGGTPTTSGGASSGGANPGGTAGLGGATGGSAGSLGGGGASGGSAGTNAAGSAGAGGGTAATPSAGCSLPANQESEEWVQRSFTIQNATRDAWVWLPENYDPNRAYPVVFLFHGCTNITNNVPMWNVVGDDAILVRGAGISNNICWDSGPNSADIEFFDAMVESVSSSHCVDTSRIFGVGYSSGSWLLNRLECVRGDVLRAVGTVAGGGSNNPTSCVDTVARVFVHDLDDMENVIENQLDERDRLVELNGCNADLPPVPEDPAPCARYQGCDPANPVIWCATSGEEHGRQDAFASEAFWGLFSGL